MRPRPPLTPTRAPHFGLRGLGYPLRPHPASPWAGRSPARGPACCCEVSHVLSCPRPLHWPPVWPLVLGPPVLADAHLSAPAVPPWGPLSAAPLGLSPNARFAHLLVAWQSDRPVLLPLSGVAIGQHMTPTWPGVRAARARVVTPSTAAAPQVLLQEAALGGQPLPSPGPQGQRT